MRSIRRILVAVKDPATRSSAAVAKAAQLAHALDAELELFHGIATPAYTDALVYSDWNVAEIEHSTRAQYLKQLERVASRLRADGLKVAVSSEWDYPAYEAVVRHAVRIKADLIVAEQHAGRRTTPWLLHLTDWELLRLSPVPVLLVKSARRYRRPVVLAALDPGHAFAKPAKLDGEILQAGTVIASALRGALHVLHAYVPVPVGAVPAEAVDESIVKRIEAGARAKARASLDRALRKADIPSTRRHLVARHPINAIQETARELGSDIVVMGAVARSGLKRVLIGNTAEQVLSQLTCDVLVVKPPSFASRVSPTRRGVRLIARGLPMI
jgi:universal stress protein E